MKFLSRVVFISLCLGIGWLSLTALADDSAGTVTALDADGLLSSGEVVAVIDGDTVDIEIGGQVERVRLIGIDTPETVSRSVPVQCFGPEASDALKGLLPAGTTVRIERGAEARDRYERLLLYLYRHDDDLFVNAWLVEGGFAEAVSYPPNDKLAARFTKLRNEAREQGRGLWGVCDGPDQPLE